jgi:hypothetical protein
LLFERQTQCVEHNIIIYFTSSKLSILPWLAGARVSGAIIAIVDRPRLV